MQVATRTSRPAGNPNPCTANTTASTTAHSSLRPSPIDSTGPNHDLRDFRLMVRVWGNSLVKDLATFYDNSDAVLLLPPEPSNLALDSHTVA